MAERNAEIVRFQRYLQIPSVQPEPDYGPIGVFLKEMAKDCGLELQTYEPVPKKPVFVITYLGTDSNLPAILLNSHTDVVPVYPERWRFPPFSAHIDELGNIYARGSQDMKCVGMQFIEVVRRLSKRGEKLKRTLHLSFVPDEEVGGANGMGAFVATQDFKKLNVGFALDEGVASEDDIYRVYYAERNVWWVEVTCHGNPGHGSKFIEGTAMEKANKVIGKAFEFREEQRQKLLGNPKLTLGDVTTLNVTKVEGGVEHNVVPAQFTIWLDIRVAITEDFEQSLFKGVTSTGPDNLYWTAFEAVLNKRGLKFKKEVFLGATDSRYVRQTGIPAIGFSPMAKTPQLLHDHNEYLNKDVYLAGIDIFEDLIVSVANC